MRNEMETGLIWLLQFYVFLNLIKIDFFVSRKKFWLPLRNRCRCNFWRLSWKYFPGVHTKIIDLEETFQDLTSSEELIYIYIIFGSAFFSYLAQSCLICYRCWEEAMDQLETLDTKFLYVHLIVLAAFFMFRFVHFSLIQLF